MEVWVQWVLGILVTIGIAAGGWFANYVTGRLSAVETDVYDAIEKLRIDVDDKRKETRDVLLELVNTKFDAIWESIRDLKDRIS